MTLRNLLYFFLLIMQQLWVCLYLRDIIFLKWQAHKCLSFSSLSCGARHFDNIILNLALRRKKYPQGIKIFSFSEGSGKIKTITDDSDRHIGELVNERDFECFKVNYFSDYL